MEHKTEPRIGIQISYECIVHLVDRKGIKRTARDCRNVTVMGYSKQDDQKLGLGTGYCYITVSLQSL